ncbi:MAG: DUF4383 domain-containing protein [Acidobacteriia bacterium]|jgi:hypothetical protein|nr:DUF4383 domain-containing protein [Terriglobia bacterium]
MAKTYALVVGVVLLLVGIVGFFVGDSTLFGLGFTMHHNVIHVLSGAIGLWAGSSKNVGAARMYALIFGAIYTLVAIAGFATGSEDLFGIPLKLNTTYNVIHLLIGVLGLAAGFTGAKATATAQ